MICSDFLVLVRILAAAFWMSVARGAWEGGTREGESGFGDER